ncbi:MAG TPA: hypothetical protein VIH72_13205 [Candidatus Acidoferrales bacterium]
MGKNIQSGNTVGQNTTNSARESSVGNFSENGYLILKNLVTDPALAFLYEYASKAAEFGKGRLDDEQAPNTPSWYGDAIMESLLEALLPRLEIETGIKLYPTYAYFRVYKHGDILKRHTDRPACEVSVTLSIGYTGNESWPIWIEQSGVARSFALEPGDALIYKGVQLPHWRDSFSGERAAQVFMHYVDRNGPFREWRLDKRTSLASTPISRQILNGLGFMYGNIQPARQE